jgi:hypothetical protein
MTKSKPSRLTHPQTKRAWEWFAGCFGLCEWKITVDLSDDAPAWAGKVSEGIMGRSMSDLGWREARVWVSSARCRRLGADPLSMFFHECAHVLAVESGIHKDGARRREYLWTRLGKLWAAAYRAKVKPPI